MNVQRGVCQDMAEKDVGLYPTGPGGRLNSTGEASTAPGEDFDADGSAALAHEIEGDGGFL
jgi:hypothetical protein